jgi:hypothetical protein
MYRFDRQFFGNLSKPAQHDAFILVEAKISNQKWFNFFAMLIKYRKIIPLSI